MQTAQARKASIAAAVAGHNNCHYTFVPKFFPAGSLSFLPLPHVQFTSFFLLSANLCRSHKQYQLNFLAPEGSRKASRKRTSLTEQMSYSPRKAKLASTPPLSRLQAKKASASLLPPPPPPLPPPQQDNSQPNLSSNRQSRSSSQQSSRRSRRGTSINS